MRRQLPLPSDLTDTGHAPVRRIGEGAARIIQTRQCHFASRGDDTRRRVLLTDTFTWVTPVLDFLRNDRVNSKRLP